MLGRSDSSAGKQTLGVKFGGLITTTHWMGELTPRLLSLSLSLTRTHTQTHDLKKKKRETETKKISFS